MERNESTKKFEADDEGRKEIGKTQRSRQENGSTSPAVTGEREKSENPKKRHRTTRPRDRRRERRASRRRRRSGLEKQERGKSISRKNTKKMGLSDLSSSTIVKRLSRRRTRASLHSPNRHKHKSAENVPAIPKRVFKALHLMRHEKFLRVVSRYLKPGLKL